jgi:hypothetical protein
MDEIEGKNHQEKINQFKNKFLKMVIIWPVFNPNLIY